MPSGSEPRSLVVLGAGLSGLAAAWRLSEIYRERVVVIEKNSYVGGLAASVSRLGRQFDLGSHRIHHSIAPEMLALIRELCGGELQERMREGLILVDGRFIRYPPRPADLLRGLGLGKCALYTAGMIAARMRKLFVGKDAESFESYILSNLGRPLYTSFYEPYARKLWGVSPHILSDESAKKRIRRVIVTELKRLGDTKRDWRYFYPAKGIGAIAEGLKYRIMQNGGRIVLDADVTKLETHAGQEVSAVHFRTKSGTESIKIENLISTIPPDALSHLLDAEKPADISFGLRWRALRILFLETRDAIERRPETYYVSSPDYLAGRISEIAKYSPNLNPEDGWKAFTIEIPCTQDDEIWRMDEQQLAMRCAKELAEFGIIRSTFSEPPHFASMVLDHVYPFYAVGWQEQYAAVCAYFSSFSNLYRIGRTALFLHCNLDHSIAMGLKLGTWLTQSNRNRDDWLRDENQFRDYYVRE